VTLRLQVARQSEGNGLASDLTHAQSPSDANSVRVASGPVTHNPHAVLMSDDLKVLPGSPILGGLDPQPKTRPPRRTDVVD